MAKMCLRHGCGLWASCQSFSALGTFLSPYHFFKSTVLSLPSASHHPLDIPIAAPPAPVPHRLGLAQMECPHSALLKCLWGVRAGAHIFGLTAGFWKATCPSTCSSPLLAFVNSKSGDNQGVKFLRKFKQFLNPAQVFDLMNGGPHLG